MTLPNLIKAIAQKIYTQYIRKGFFSFIISSLESRHWSFWQVAFVTDTRNVKKKGSSGKSVGELRFRELAHRQK